MAELRRLHAAELPREGGDVKLSADSARHAQVLRLRVGDRVCLFDAAGLEADAEITHAHRDTMTCRAEPPRATPEPAHKLTLVLGVPKAPKLEPIVRMTTELGVHALRLAHSERSVPKLSSDSPKLERLRRVAREACAQSGQARALEIVAPEPLFHVAQQAPAGAARVVFYENATLSLERALVGLSPASLADVWAVVGPEGGLDIAEVEALVQLGYRQVGLGEGILRVDTAAVVASALLLDRMRR
ncbi:MAG TPA: RsmE family RNA methyltransferase [Polyangiales bacterium]|nr:RsmE family RNA methyltransferase [Polyangiales bacterium]